MKKYIYAFTLAEVLITLAVIGVVASLTIPTLYNKYLEHQAVAAVKETYSLVAQAIKQWENENGCPGEAYKCEQGMDWQWGEVYPEEPRLGWTKYLKVVGAHQIRWEAPPEWQNYQNYNMDGTPVPDASDRLGIHNAIDGSHMMDYLLANGVIIAASAYDNISIWMDINGRKPPNRIGKDQFPFGVGRVAGDYSISPYYSECTYIGTNYGLCSNNCPNPCNPDDGKSPTAYVLLHNKLPDLVGMGYSP